MQEFINRQLIARHLEKPAVNVHSMKLLKFFEEAKQVGVRVIFWHGGANRSSVQ